MCIQICNLCSTHLSKYTYKYIYIYKVGIVVISQTMESFSIMHARESILLMATQFNFNLRILLRLIRNHLMSSWLGKVLSILMVSQDINGKVKGLHLFDKLWKKLEWTLSKRQQMRQKLCGLGMNQMSYGMRFILNTWFVYFRMLCIHSHAHYYRHNHYHY